MTPIAPMTLGSAMHPMTLRDGRLMFSSYESQGLRDSRLWGLWAIQPDGRRWEPLVSAFHDGQAFHFSAQLGNSDIVVEDYYNLNNSGFGALYRFPAKPPGGGPAFAGAFAKENPAIEHDPFIGPARLVLAAVQPARRFLDHAIHARLRRGRAGRAGGARVGKVDPSVRRPAQRSAPGVDARARQSSRSPDRQCPMWMAGFT